MATPRPSAKMKIKKDGLTFESNVDAVLWSLNELIQAANADTGKYIRKMTINAIKADHGKSIRGKRLSHAVGYWARKREGDLQVGFGHTKYKRSGDAWYAVRQELGTKEMPKKGYLRNTVYANIPQIIKIQSQYLSGMNDWDKVKGSEDEEMSED